MSMPSRLSTFASLAGILCAAGLVRPPAVRAGEEDQGKTTRPSVDKAREAIRQSEDLRRQQEQLRDAGEAARQEDAKKQAKPKHRWGEVRWDGCIDDLLCGADTKMGTLKKADLADMFGEACVTILKSKRYLDDGSWDRSGMENYLRLWLKELDPNLDPSRDTKAERRLMEILLGALAKCKKGIQFECGNCVETTTAFKIPGVPGGPAAIGTFNPDTRICPGLCSRQRNLAVRTLAHEITHYGGSDDEDKVGALRADRLEDMLPALAAEYDATRR